MRPASVATRQDKLNFLRFILPVSSKPALAFQEAFSWALIQIHGHIHDENLRIAFSFDAY